MLSVFCRYKQKTKRVETDMKKGLTELVFILDRAVLWEVWKAIRLVVLIP